MSYCICHIKFVTLDRSQYICHIEFVTLHMGDFTQPKQKYAGTGENYKIAVAVIFYPGIKSL